MNRYSLLAVLITAIGIVVPCAQAELVGHWTFDSSSNLGDASASDDLLVVGDAAYSAAGMLGGALALDGSGDYLARSGDALPAGLPLGDSSFTVAMWMKLDATADPVNVGYGMVGWGSYGSNDRVNAFRTGNNAEIDSTYRGNGEGTSPTDFSYGIGHYSWGGYADIFRGADGQASRPDIDDGRWHLVTATFDSMGAGDGIKTLFADALQIGASKSMGNLNVTSGAFRIGCTNNNEYFLGLLDDVAVWDRALAAGELETLYALASSATYAYDAGDVDRLLVAHGEQSMFAVTVKGTSWTYKDGLAGAEGLSADGQTLVIDSAAGTGMIVVPEPTALCLLGLGALSLLRRRRTPG